MKKDWKRIIAFLLLSFTYVFQITAAMATTMSTTTQSSTSSASPNSADVTYDPATANDLQNLSINSENLSLSGPLSVGVNYDTLFNTIFNAQFAQKFTHNFALGAIGEYGENQYRLNGTAGFQLYPEGQVKLSAEYLSQVLPFSFDSGDINQRVNQSAYGFKFQHNLNQATFQNINFGGYWAQAPNKDLSTLTFMGDDGLEYMNQRNLAGATSQGLDLGSTIVFTPMTSLDATLYYDNVNYDTELTNDTSYNSSGVGGELRINQLVGDRMRVSADASSRALYNTYGAEVAYAPEFAKSLGMNISLFAQHLISHNQTPNSNTYGIQFGFLSDDGVKAPNYQLGNNATATDLGEWVKDPAIYMDRVLVISEQITTLSAPSITAITPSSGPTTGGNTVVIAGSNFMSGTQVLFGGQPASTVTIISPTQLTVLVPAATLSQAGPVNVTVNNPDHQSFVLNDGYTYLTNPNIPTVTNVSPRTGIPAGGTSVTITGTNFNDATAVNFGDTPATSFTVNSSTSITATSPAQTDGNVVNVTVTTPVGTSAATPANQFAYEAEPLGAPTITEVNPNEGPSMGGTSVTITGTNFVDVTEVNFAGIPATSYIVNSPTSITAISPPGLAYSTANVTVTNTTDTSAISPADEFFYYL